MALHPLDPEALAEYAPSEILDLLRDRAIQGTSLLPCERSQIVEKACRALVRRHARLPGALDVAEGHPKRLGIVEVRGATSGSIGVGLANRLAEVSTPKEFRVLIADGDTPQRL